MLSHAQCTKVLGVLDLMSVIELATESRMIIHITVWTIHSFILGLLLVKLEDLTYPIHIQLLFMLRQGSSLIDWTRLDHRLDRGILDEHLERLDLSMAWSLRLDLFGALLLSLAGFEISSSFPANWDF